MPPSAPRAFAATPTHPVILMDIGVKDDRWCFACGSKNPCGLQLGDIHLEGEDCVCSFTPGQVHQGWSKIVHGGITATLLDEIMTHALYRRGFDAVTAELNIRLREKVPVGDRLTVRARIVRQRRQFAETEGALTLSDGTIAATATAKFFVERRGPDQPGGHITLAAREAVIFDLFGTLVPCFDRADYEACVRRMGDAVGVEGGLFYELFRSDAPQRTTGQWCDLEGNVADIARRAGASASTQQVAEAVRTRFGYTREHLMNPLPDAIEALEALTRAGRPVGLISDCSPEAPALWSESPLSRYIEAPVFSCSVGLRKPDPAIYAAALERMGVDAYQTVYVGDGDSRELPGAAAVGLCPVLVDRGTDSAFRADYSGEAGIIVKDLTQLLPLIGLS